MNASWLVKIVFIAFIYRMFNASAIINRWIIRVHIHGEFRVIEVGRVLNYFELSVVRISQFVIHTVASLIDDFDSRHPKFTKRVFMCVCVCVCVCARGHVCMCPFVCLNCRQASVMYAGIPGTNTYPKYRRVCLYPSTYITTTSLMRPTL